MQNDWPGNVRELENFIRRFLVLPDLETISDQVTGPSLNGSSKSVVNPQYSQYSLLNVGAEAADLAERILVEQTLLETNGNRKKAAQRLNICYKALLNKLHRWEGRNGPASDFCVPHL